MLWIGIIAEWQPLHLGHARLLEEVHKTWPEAGILGVISGPFDQRGQATLWDKWTRTRMALAQGVDLVLELPQYAATASLESFARGGAEILEACGVDGIAFGSETGDLAMLRAQARALRGPNPTLQKALDLRLKAGYPYGPALQASLEEVIPDLGPSRLHPNDRLNRHYLRFLPDTLDVLPVKRGPEVSGSAIRRLVLEGQDPSPYLPSETRPFIGDRPPLFPHLLYEAGRRLGLGLGPEGLQKALHLGDGSENHLDRSFKAGQDWASFLDLASNRHFSRARLARLLLQLLAPLTAKKPGPPPYLRVLGARPKGRDLLRNRLHPGPVPVLVNPGRDQADLSPSQIRHFEEDVRRQNLWQSLVQGPQVFDRDFRTPPIFRP